MNAILYQRIHRHFTIDILHNKVNNNEKRKKIEPKNSAVLGCVECIFLDFFDCHALCDMLLRSMHFNTACVRVSKPYTQMKMFMQ